MPGHHLQIAIGAGARRRCPPSGATREATAFIEGWGLYSERLADEMGLYAGDLDRIGMLRYDAWRACRLVVDTGMHALGWSRAAGDRVHDRPHARWRSTTSPTRWTDTSAGPARRWPTRSASSRSGASAPTPRRHWAHAFDIRAFHDAVLGHGPLPLATMREAVTRDLAM